MPEETNALIQDYQIPALQQQLRSIKDLRRQYEATHASFVALVPELAHVGGIDPCSTPNPPAEVTGSVDGDPGSVPVSQPSAAKSGSGGDHDTGDSGLLKAMQCQMNHLGTTASLEQTAAFVLATELDRFDACAVLTGNKSRYYLHQSTVSVGRTSIYKGKVCLFSKSISLIRSLHKRHQAAGNSIAVMQVDIDLTLEGASTNISRYTCFIDLDLSYGFLLHNIGKQLIRVNNIEVPTGHKIKLPHLSLVEVVGITLLFQVNAEAIVRLCLKPPPCPA